MHASYWAIGSCYNVGSRAVTPFSTQTLQGSSFRLSLLAALINRLAKSAAGRLCAQAQHSNTVVAPALQSAHRNLSLAPTVFTKRLPFPGFGSPLQSLRLQVGSRHDLHVGHAFALLQGGTAQSVQRWAPLVLFFTALRGKRVSSAVKHSGHTKRVVSHLLQIHASRSSCVPGCIEWWT